MFKLRTFRLTALILSATAFGWSCGDHNPISNEPAMTYEEAVRASQAEGLANPLTRPGFVVFTPRAVAAAKRLSFRDGVIVREESKLIDDGRGGTIKVNMPNYGSWKEIVRIDKAEFEVEKHSITGVEPDRGKDKYRITMSVSSGKTLQDVVVAFDPDGMNFSPAAKLTIKLVGDVDVRQLVGYHVSGDGKHVSKVRLRVRQRRGECEVVVDVPGFSEYSWDDDDITDDDPCALPDSGCWGY